MMKRITSLITLYQLTSSQAPPAVPAVPALPSLPSNPGGIILAPPGQVIGAYGQFCNGPAPDTECPSITYVLTSQDPGFTKCEKDYDCCLCKGVQCGDLAEGCTVFSAGNYGVYGVKAIDILGKALGAQINCLGVESCAESVITGTNIKDIDGAGYMALKNAKITVTNPVAGFSLQCVDADSCDSLSLELVIPPPPTGYQCDPSYVETVYFNQIQCVQPGSCRNMDVTVRNDGCNAVVIGKLECIQPNSCSEASFNLIGNVEFGNCDLRGSAGSSATGISTCFDNLQRLLCPEPTSCVGAVRTLYNPLNGFMLSCGNTGSCQDAKITIDVDNTAPQLITYWEGFKFPGEGSGAGATITVNNKQGVVINIERIECATTGACVGTTFIIGHDVSVGEIICTSGTCNGCVIKVDAQSPGIPCDPNEVPSVIQNPIEPIPQTPVVPIPQNPIEPIPQTPVVPIPQNPVVPIPQNPYVPIPQGPFVPI